MERNEVEKSQVHSPNQEISPLTTLGRDG